MNINRDCRFERREAESRNLTEYKNSECVRHLIVCDRSVHCQIPQPTESVGFGMTFIVGFEEAYETIGT